LPNGHVHTNGDVVPPKPAPPMFIDGRSVDEEPSAVTAPSATKPIKKLVDGDIPTSDGEEEEREIIEHSAEGKRKGRKRKAPKEVS